MNKVKMLFNSIVLVLLFLTVTYIGGTHYLQTRYVSSIKNYYNYVDENTKIIDEIIYKTEDEKLLKSLFTHLETYIFINNEFIEKESIDINEVLHWQELGFKKAKFGSYIGMYKLSKSLENSQKRIETIINNSILEKSIKEN
ncbi:hypothetical protein H3N56_00635 [Cetobacterium sp. 2A]|uniref:hypothetical protein n=1 Tax=unclassified Cetobacterium TaxID=2630983 RepID=UPI00163D00F3|nr:hypothetical protein [Cetobacterium sp. 2A]MBC2855003.1 hypothetical protein [Cetobacterium sp. 2A]